MAFELRALFVRNDLKHERTPETDARDAEIAAKQAQGKHLPEPEGAPLPETNDKLAKKAQGTVVGSMALTLFCAVAALFCALVVWGSSTFQVSFDAVVATMAGPLEGTGSGMLESALAAILPATIVVAVGVGVLLWWLRRRVREAQGTDDEAARTKTYRRALWTRRGLFGAAAAVTAGSVVAGDQHFKVLDYAESQMSTTDLYENRYVDPRTVTIAAPEKKKNLLMIYLESMETTYASTEAGGRQEVNYIPNLTRLAQENVSFSNTEQLGGSRPVKGTTWTIGSLVSSSSGVPFRFPVESGNDTYQTVEGFATGLYALGDFLADEGYTQEFACGSDATFGGRRNYFSTHGGYDFYDLYTARENGDIPEDYFVWWGFEDARLFPIAQKELTRLAAAGEPFNFTMLTVDLHHMDGYFCEKCVAEHEVPTANVAVCTDQQVSDFVAWVQEQPWAEDTLIVIAGDHPRMDSNLVDGVEYLDRTEYNCIINGPEADPAVLTNREFTPMDLFPTIVSALGYQVEGERLGIGTNLYSSEQTLAEEMGLEELQTEIAKNSDWYNHTFSPELYEQGAAVTEDGESAS